MSDMKYTKYVTLEIGTSLCQQDMNRLIEHLRNLEGFGFIIKSKVYTGVKIVEEQRKKFDIMNSSSVRSKFLPHTRRISIPTSMM